MKYQENFVTGEVRKIVEVGDIFFFKSRSVYGTVIAKCSGVPSGYIVSSGKYSFGISRSALLRDAEFVGSTDRIELGTEE